MSTLTVKQARILRDSSGGSDEAPMIFEVVSKEWCVVHYVKTSNR